MTRVFKIGNVADSRKDRCGVHWADWRDREQNLSFPAVLDDLGYLHVQSLHVFLNETQFLDEQILFKQEAPLACKILCPNALGCQLLKDGSSFSLRVMQPGLLSQRHVE